VTFSTDVGFLATVYQQVILQVSFLHERSAALFASVGILAFMNHEVILQVLFRLELAMAVCAIELGGGRMDKAHMLLQMILPREKFRAK